MFKTMSPIRCKCDNCGLWMNYNRFGTISYSLSIVVGLILGMFHDSIPELLNIPLHYVWVGAVVLLVVYAIIWWRYFDFTSARR